jgi:hypothetical protein
MAITPSRARRFSSTIGDDALRFGDGMLIAPALGKEVDRPMSAYTSFFAVTPVDERLTRSAPALCH